MFEVDGFYRESTNAPSHLTVSATVETREQAEEIAGRFPKMVKLKAGTLTANRTSGAKVFGYVWLRITLESNGVNGGVNETGIKRYRSFRKAADKLGLAVTFRPQHSNSYQTEAEFHAAVNI